MSRSMLALGRALVACRTMHTTHAHRLPFCSSAAGDAAGPTAKSAKQHKKLSFQDDLKVLYVDMKNSRHEITYGELRELAEKEAAKGRELVHVTEKGHSQEEPFFQILTPAELESAVRRARHLRIPTSFDKVDSQTRVKERVALIRAGLDNHDLEVWVGKIRKWLERDYFVKVQVAKSERQEARSAEDIVSHIRAGCKDVLAQPGKEKSLFVNVTAANSLPKKSK